MNSINSLNTTHTASGLEETTLSTLNSEAQTDPISIRTLAHPAQAAHIGEQTGGLMVVQELPLDQNPAAVYLAHLTPGGQRTMGEALNKIAALLTEGRATALTCRWSALRFQHTAAVRAKLAATYKPATANRMIRALRGTLKMAWRLGQMSAEEYHRAADIPAVRGETVPAGRELGHGEIAALIAACQRDDKPAGARDAAIISLMYSGGLRREEVVALRVEDYDQDDERLLVKGKGNKERNIYPEDGASDALADWLSVRGNTQARCSFLLIRQANSPLAH